MNLKTIYVALALGAIALLSGCASNGDYYDEGYSSRDRSSYEREYCGNCGTVVAIERTRVRNNELGGGTLLGAVIGGALGNQVGKGDGRKAATIAGAVVGGAIGHEAEKDGRRSREGFLISVRMQDGRIQRVVQPDPYGLREGDRVVLVDGRAQPERG